MLNIYKIGGDITGDYKKIILALELFKKDLSNKVIVVSAARGVTDELINSVNKEETVSDLLQQHLKLASDLGLDKDNIVDKLKLELKNIYHENFDEVISLGERLIAIILTEYFNINNLKVNSTTGYDSGILVENGTIVKSFKDHVKNFIKNNFLDKNITPLITGFDGISNGKRVTLGRSGSDQTATFLSYALNADAVYLLKDTKGVQTADPSIVENSKNIQHLSYDMAMEADNIQLEAIRYVKKDSIPLYIQYIENPEIKTKVDYHCIVSGIKLITGIENCIFFEVGEIMDQPGSEKEIFDAFFKYKINKEISLDTRNSVAFVLDSGLDKISSVIKELKDHSIKIQNCSLITIIGNIDRNNKQLFEDYTWEICEPLSSASWIKGSIVANMVVPREKYKQVIKHLHKKFIEDVKN